jgi:amino acid transporter
LWTTFSVVFIAVAIVYLSTLQAPGVTVLQDASLPLSFAFSNAFNISYNAASCLNIPISLASFVIAMYYMIAILKAMASSGLLPVRLLRTMGNEQTPYEAMRVTYMGAVLITMIYIASAVAGPFYALMMYTLSTFYLYSLWIGLMVAYLMFKRKYASLKRSFRSPLGVWGAYIAIFSAVQHFVTQFYPIHSYSIAPFIVFVLSMAVLTVVYHRYIIKYQKYSEEEERVFFVTYIVTGEHLPYHVLFCPPHGLTVTSIL